MCCLHSGSEELPSPFFKADYLSQLFGIPFCLGDLSLLLYLCIYLICLYQHVLIDTYFYILGFDTSLSVAQSITALAIGNPVSLMYISIIIGIVGLKKNI